MRSWLGSTLGRAGRVAGRALRISRRLPVLRPATGARGHGVLSIPWRLGCGAPRDRRDVTRDATSSPATCHCVCLFARNWVAVLPAVAVVTVTADPSAAVTRGHGRVESKFKCEARKAPRSGGRGGWRQCSPRRRNLLCRLACGYCDAACETARRNPSSFPSPSTHPSRGYAVQALVTTS